MKQASETGLVASRSNRRPQVRLSMVGCSSPLPTLPEIPASPLIIATSTADRSDDVLSARPTTISQSSTPHEQATSYGEWDPIPEVDSHGQSVSKCNQSDNKFCDALKPVQTLKRALPVRKVSTGKLTITNKVRPIFTGVENERKLPSMRFSPTLSPVRPRRPLPEGPAPKSRLALGTVTPQSPAPAAAKTATTPKTKSQSRTLLIRRPRSSMSGISTKSKIPIPVNHVDTQTNALDTVENAADELIHRLMDEQDEVSPTTSESNSSLGSSIVVVVSPTDSTTSVVTDVTSPDTPSGIEVEVLEYGVSRPAGYVHGVKVETLQALGYYDPVFRDEKAFLEDFPSLLEQLESKNFEGDVQYDLAGIKLKELGERIAVVNAMYHDAKRTGAPENEIMCITGWGEDLLRETSKIQKTEVKYHKAWIRHVVDWLWDVENMKTGIYDDQQDTPEKPTQPANHPLFNLVETTKELIRGGFNGKEKDVVLLWADIRGIPLLASACGKMVIHEYITRLARWDGCKLERHAIQERRMHYL